MRVWTSLTAHFGSETRRIGGLLRGCFLSCLRSRRNSGESIMGQRFMFRLDQCTSRLIALMKAMGGVVGTN
ncbi:hypothetical protein F2P79_004936 [Pimephales promelas]|nr:hypothetical protein F2P79_004936 [Pimephales promelas]